MKLIPQKTIKILNKRRSAINLTGHYKKLIEVLETMINDSTLKYNYFYKNRNGERVYLVTMSEAHAKNALNYFKKRNDKWYMINQRPWWADDGDDWGYFLFDPYY